ncbi:MAG TPA: DNA alkylation repair protein [archaeon]|nr:DNA alkylation repair protein [archaeon]
MSIQSELKEFATWEKVEVYKRFFKTGKGEYGFGDVFLGVTVPETRAVAKKFVDIPLAEVTKSLQSKFHEERMAALFVLVYKFQKAEVKERKKIYDFYISNIRYTNNWDLVDCVADKIAGPYLINRDKKILYKFAISENLWKRRVAIITTFHFIKNNSFEDTLKISEILLNDTHDLIHKAVGWMLREIGKRDKKVLIKFLEKNSKKMPRTMLRYAIEKFSKKERKKFLGNN